MHKRLHVLIIPSWYPKFEGDYEGSFFREQALALIKNNCKVGVLFPELKSLRGLETIRIIPKFNLFNDNGILTYVFKWSNWFIKNKFLQIKVFKFLGNILFKKYIFQNGIPDLIHCQSIFNAGFLGENLFEKYNIPFVITEHNSGFKYKKQGFQKYYDSVIRITNKAEKCFTVSSSYSEFLKEELSNNLEWEVHNNIVSDLFLNTDLKKPDSKNFIFLTINRLHRIKNISLLIESFFLFTEKFPNSELRIIGIGNELKSLKLLSKSFGIEKKVKFLGRIDRSRIPKEMNDSHIYVHSSIYETFGVVFVEALAMGKPIITTNCKGPNDIVNDDVGIILKNNNSDELSNAMLTVYENYKFYDPLRLREYCKNKFSEIILTKKLIKHYREILSKKFKS